jgi:V8-like Glu-specific endopeptidase
MTKSVFDELQELLARGALEPVLPRVLNLTRGAGPELGDNVAATAVALSGQFYDFQLNVVSGVRSPDQLDRDRNALRLHLSNYVRLLEQRWQYLPQPAVGPPPGDEPPRTPGGGAQPLARDPREAAVEGNPIRRLAWLEEGLRVSKAVCKIRTPEKIGTGFLISRGRIVTNNHVLPTRELARNSIAIFNFQEDLAGGATIPINVPLAPGRHFSTAAEPDIDCTVVAAGEQEGEVLCWGALTLNGNDAVDSASVSIIQHPEGGYKQIALAGNVVSSKETTSIRYATSTMKGSSGAPVFDDGWRVIALHQGGGTWSVEHQRYLNNRGIRISALLRHTHLGEHLR